MCSTVFTPDIVFIIQIVQIFCFTKILFTMYSLVRLHLHTTCITSSIDKLIFYQFSLTYNFNSMNPINDATPDEVAMTIFLFPEAVYYILRTGRPFITPFSVSRASSVILVQCSTNWVIEPTGSWSHCEFAVYP